MQTTLFNSEQLGDLPDSSSWKQLELELHHGQPRFRIPRRVVEVGSRIHVYDSLGKLESSMEDGVVSYYDECGKLYRTYKL